MAEMISWLQSPLAEMVGAGLARVQTTRPMRFDSVLIVRRVPIFTCDLGELDGKGETACKISFERWLRIWDIPNWGLIGVQNLRLALGMQAHASTYNRLDVVIEYRSDSDTCFSPAATHSTQACPYCYKPRLSPVRIQGSAPAGHHTLALQHSPSPHGLLCLANEHRK